MADDTKETSLAAARALFSTAPEPPPEPSRESGNIFEYLPEAADWIPPGCMVVVEGRKLDERAAAEVRAVVEALSVRDAPATLSLPEGVSVRFLPIPIEMNPSELIQALVDGHTAIEVGSPNMTILPESVEANDNDPTRAVKLFKVKGRVLSLNEAADMGIPVIRPADAGMIVERAAPAFDDGMNVADDGALRAEVTLAVPVGKLMGCRSCPSR